MSTDIKATVAGLERDIAELPGNTTRLFQVGPHINYREVERAGRNIVEAEHRVKAALPSLLAELRRLWFIEEAAVSLREAQNAYRSCKKLGAELDDAWESIIRSEHRLFAALPLRKPSGGEDGKP